MVLLIYPDCSNQIANNLLIPIPRLRLRISGIVHRDRIPPLHSYSPGI